MFYPHVKHSITVWKSRITSKCWWWLYTPDKLPKNDSKKIRKIEDVKKTNEQSLFQSTSNNTIIIWQMHYNWLLYKYASVLNYTVNLIYNYNDQILGKSNINFSCLRNHSHYSYTITWSSSKKCWFLNGQFHILYLPAAIPSYIPLNNKRKFFPTFWKPFCCFLNCDSFYGLTINPKHCITFA